MNELLISDEEFELSSKLPVTQYLKKPSGSIYLESDEVSMLGRKTFNLLLKHAQPEMLTKNLHEIDMSVFRIGIDSKANTNYLKGALKKLARVSVEWNVINRDNKKEWGVASLLSGAKIIEGKKLYYSFHPDLKPLLADPTVYALIDIKIQNKFSSKYAIILYEIAVDYYREVDKRGETPLITLTEFKKIMGVASIKSYKTFSNLKKFVIEAPMREVNDETDFEMKYKLKKKGRSYTYIKFIISKPQLITVEASKTKEREIPSELKIFIPKGQLKGLKGCEQVCMEILKNQGIEVLEFYVKQTKELDKKKKRTSWGRTIRAALKRGDYEKYKKELDEKKRAEAQKRKENKSEEAALQAKENQTKKERAEKMRLIASLTDDQALDFESWLTVKKKKIHDGTKILYILDFIKTIKQQKQEKILGLEPGLFKNQGYSPI